MALKISRVSATPNLVKYTIEADEEGGEGILTHEELLRDVVTGPLRTYLQRKPKHVDTNAAAMHLLYAPAIRAILFPSTIAPVAISADIDKVGAGQFNVSADPSAKAIFVLELRHSMSS